MCLYDDIILKNNPDTKPENLHIILGPHIKNCCYQVDQERKEYFCYDGNKSSQTGINTHNFIENFLKLKKDEIFVNAITEYIDLTVDKTEEQIKR